MTRFSSPGHSGFPPGWLRALFAFVVLFATYDISRPNVSATKPTKFMIIGYVFGPANFYGIGAEKLTHINYAFALVS